MTLRLYLAFAALVLFFWSIGPSELVAGELLDDIADQIRQWDASLNAAGRSTVKFIRDHL